MRSQTMFYIEFSKNYDKLFIAVQHFLKNAVKTKDWIPHIKKNVVNNHYPKKCNKTHTKEKNLKI